MKILILEDNARYAEKLKKVLVELEHEIFWAQNPKDALAYLEKGTFPELGIFDIQLRDKMDGLDVAQKFREKIQIPIIMATDYSDDSAYFNKSQKIGIDLDFFRDKRQFESSEFVQKIIEEAIDNFNYPSPTPFEYLLYKDRKIGFLSNAKGARVYKFYGKDEIIYLKGEKDNTIIYLAGGKEVTISRNLGKIGAQIENVFYNIIRMGRSYYVNIEKIKSLEGTTLTLENNAIIPLSPNGLQVLKKNNLLISTKKSIFS